MIENNLLDGKGEALDLGCGKGSASSDLLSLGYKITSVDKMPTQIEGVNFVASDIRDFTIEKGKFSVIVCNNVLPFINDKKVVIKLINQMIEGLTQEGVLYFSIFGIHDAWAGDSKMSFFSYDEISSIVDSLTIKTFEKNSFEGYGKTMRGDMKYWHIFRFVLTNKIPK